VIKEIDEMYPVNVLDECTITEEETKNGRKVIVRTPNDHTIVYLTTVGRLHETTYSISVNGHAYYYESDVGGYSESILMYRKAITALLGYGSERDKKKKREAQEDAMRVAENLFTRIKVKVPARQKD